MFHNTEDANDQKNRPMLPKSDMKGVSSNQLIPTYLPGTNSTNSIK